MNKFGIKEYSKKDYKEFFEWLLEKEVNINEMIDITLLDSHEKPMVYYPDEIKSLLETKAMQRLKRVAQLGSALFANEDEYHTRFSHSVGAGNNAQMFFLKLYKENPKWKDYIEKNDKKEEIFADIIQMYLHDIGHNVLSHTLESLIRSNDPNADNNAAAHEVLGKRIINNDPEILGVLSSISPTFLQTLNNVMDPNYDLRSLKEGAIDFDRMDYLIRDALYHGDYEDRYMTEKAIQNGNITIENENGVDRQIPVWSEKAKRDIMDFLERRKISYQNNYFSNESIALDRIAVYFCEKIAIGNYNCELKDYIVHCIKKGGNGIDLEYFKNWDDTRFYSEVIKIAQNHPDKDMRDLAITCLPNLRGLTNFAFEACDLDTIKDIEQLEPKQKEFFETVKDLVKNKSELHDILLKKKGSEMVVLDARSNEDMQEVFDDLVNGGISRKKLQSLISWSKTVYSYNPEDPINIINPSQEISLLQTYINFSNATNVINITGALAYPMQMQENGFAPKEIKMVQDRFIKYNMEHKKEKNKLPSSLKDCVECVNNMKKEKEKEKE